MLVATSAIAPVTALAAKLVVMPPGEGSSGMIGTGPHSTGQTIWEVRNATYSKRTTQSSLSGTDNHDMG